MSTCAVTNTPPETSKVRLQIKNIIDKLDSLRTPPTDFSEEDIAKLSNANTEVCAALIGIKAHTHDLDDRILDTFASRDVKLKGAKLEFKQRFEDVEKAFENLKLAIDEVLNSKRVRSV